MKKNLGKKKYSQKNLASVSPDFLSENLIKKNFFISKFIKAIPLSWLVYVFLLFSALSFLQYTSLKPENLSIEFQGVVQESDRYTFFAYDKVGVYTYKFNLEVNRLTQTKVNLTIDDCLESIEINNRILFPQDLGYARFCEWERGRLVDFKPYLVQGTNQIIINVRNYGGGTGFKFNWSIKNPIVIFSSVVIILSILLILYEISSILKFTYLQTAILWSGFAIRVLYYSFTGFHVRHHDALGNTGHIGYIHYIVQNGSFPDPKTGLEYHQAPLYYFISSLFVRLSNFLGYTNVWDMVQWISLFYFTGFLIFAILFIRLLVKNQLWQNLAILLLVFWPSLIFHSTRITNDQLLYFFLGGFLFFQTKWFLQNKSRFYLYSGVFLTLAIITKSSSIIAFGMFLGTTALKLLQNYFIVNKVDSKETFLRVFKNHFQLVFSQRFQYLKKVSKVNFNKLKLYIIAWIIIPLGFLFNDDFIQLLKGEDIDSVIGSTSLGEVLKVGEGLQHYIYFDIRKFLTVPFMNPWTDESGRQWFWNFFLKSSLFGEFVFYRKSMENLAVLISFIFLGMIVSFCWYILTKKKWSFQDLYLLAIVVLFVAGNMMHRYKNPHAPNSDFRFVLPVILPFLVLLVNSFENLWKKGQPIVNFLIVFGGLSFVLAVVWFVFIGYLYPTYTV